MLRAHFPDLASWYERICGGDAPERRECKIRVAETFARARERAGFVAATEPPPYAAGEGQQLELVL